MSTGTGRPRGRPPKDRSLIATPTLPFARGDASTPSTSQRYSTPTRSSYAHQQPPPPSYRPPPPPASAYHHPPTFTSGPVGFFLPPPGQPSRDATLQTPPTTQAIYTTYPDRLRTGVTSLVQPDVVSGGMKEREYLLAELDRELANTRSGSGTATPRFDSPAPRRQVQTTTTFSGRRAGRINYAEKGSDDDDEDVDDDEEEDEEEDDAEDEGGEGGRRGFDHSAAIRLGKLKKKRDEMDKGWTWLGGRAPGERVKSRHARATRHVYPSEEKLDAAAQVAEAIVPIAIDFDVPSNNPDVAGVRIRDRFLWNRNDTLITPLSFSTIFCEDLHIPLHPYAQTVADLIQAQLDEAPNVSEIDVVDELVGEEKVIWSEDEADEDGVEGDQDGEADAPAVNGEGADDANAEGPQDDEEEAAEEGEEEEEVVVVKEKQWTEADCRIIINLDVQIYAHLLRDRIEWDLSSPLPPTTFAKHYCTELGLTGEAIPLIAHAITDELLKHKRDALDLELFANTHPDEQAKWDRGPLPRTTSRKGAQGLVGVWRDWGEREEFGPVLVEMTREEMERREVERTREARRMMRGVAGKRRR